MRIVFGILSLVVVLAVVGVLAKQQWRAVAAAAVPEAVTGGPALVGSPAQQSQTLQRKVADDVNQALKQGTSRSEGVDR